MLKSLRDIWSMQRMGFVWGLGKYYWAEKEKIFSHLAYFDAVFRELQTRLKELGRDKERFEASVTYASEAVKILFLQGRLDENEAAFHAPLFKK